MKILAVGDSFTYGYELADTANAWPAVLARKLDATVTNMAKPGGGNTQIVRNIIEQADNHNMVVVGWASPGRVEFADALGAFDVWPGWQGRGFNAHRTDIARAVTITHNDNYLFRQFLVNILLVQGYLKSRNIPCVMSTTQGEGEHYYNTCKQNNIDLLEKIDYTQFIEWPKNGMAEWTFGCTQGPSSHFLDDGHQRVAEKYYEHIRNIGRLS